MANDWEVGVFECQKDLDLTVCCISYFWPNLQLIQQRVTLDQRRCNVFDCLFSTCCLPCATCLLRQDIRKKHELPTEGTEIIDVLLVCYCTPCVLHQQTMHLEKKGLKPAGLFMA
ncbi:hypothetical protein CYY_005426 [Polysphondylium violaceum]|uniref:PLAC8 family protein n=1 Tax=Polysphondylium violaceum TaxID=133409 RepID=A0A8J4PV32_9MYCE|nr:hypothetical protein CYY_005426 [Polysphondylium violaceum]